MNYQDKLQKEFMDEYNSLEKEVLEKFTKEEIGNYFLKHINITFKYHLFLMMLHKKGSF